jgi:uncharacterized protein YqhQ
VKRKERVCELQERKGRTTKKTLPLQRHRQKKAAQTNKKREAKACFSSLSLFVCVVFVCVFGVGVFFLPPFSTLFFSNPCMKKRERESATTQDGNGAHR